MTAIADTLDRSAADSHSVIASFFNRLVMLCAVPYALVALGLRFVMARAFFLSGQGLIEGPTIPLNFSLPFDFSITLPVELKDTTFRLFDTQYAHLPLPSAAAAYLFSYAEFVLPICLLLGFATRFAALFLLIMVALIQIYVMPDAWWSTHVYWSLILLVLMSAGPGAISLDGLVRHIYEKS